MKKEIVLRYIRYQFTDSEHKIIIIKIDKSDPGYLFYNKAINLET
mgnify:CR=1 FL=1